MALVRSLWGRRMARLRPEARPRYRSSRRVSRQGPSLGHTLRGLCRDHSSLGRLWRRQCTRLAALPGELSIEVSTPAVAYRADASALEAAHRDARNPGGDAVF